MKVLILGGGGMLGHRLLAHLQKRHTVKVTLRRDRRAYERAGHFDASNTYEGVDVSSVDRVHEICRDFRPDAIVNAVGLVKQRSIAHESIPSIEINALLPHRLALLAAGVGARFLHFSTDCVFSGRRGNYSEADTPDPDDLYGRTKLLGEVAQAHCITLRTSLIGQELDRRSSLIEWFLAQKGRVPGYRRTIFTGFTTIEMARIVDALLTEHPGAYGVWHVSSAPIDKCRLLELVKKYYDLEIEVVPEDLPCCDRSLDSSRFREHFSYTPPSWDSMIAEMSEIRSLYK